MHKIKSKQVAAAFSAATRSVYQNPASVITAHPEGRSERITFLRFCYLATGNAAKYTRIIGQISARLVEATSPREIKKLKRDLIYFRQQWEKWNAHAQRVGKYAHHPAYTVRNAATTPRV